MTLRPALVLVLLVPLAALGNGGPVGWGEPGPAGGVQPIDDRDVRLVSEDLTLTLTEDGESYRVEARYVLANPRGPRAVAFGVPVDLGSAEGEDEESGPGVADPVRTAQGIRIEVAGRRVPCQVVPGRLLPPVPAESVQPAAFRKAAGEDDEGDAAEGAPSPSSQHWCVATISLPVGEAIPLTLAYSADLAFEDWGTSKSMLRGYDGRQLRYALYPAGFWAGPPERVRIRVETGRFQGLATATPPPTGHQGSALVWELVRPDLKRLGVLTVALDAEPVLRHAELVGASNLVRQGDTEVLRATASSTLAAQGKASYDAGQVVDTRGETAWCEGAPGDGVGEWVEVRRAVRDPSGKETPGPEFCRLEGYALVPGYAKSQAAYAGNNRLRAFRLAPCGKPEAGKVFRLAPGKDPRSRQGETAYRLSPRHDRSALLVQGEEDEALDPACVRLTILEVEKGKAQDTCISELRPIFNCG